MERDPNAEAPRNRIFTPTLSILKVGGSKAVAAKTELDVENTPTAADASLP